MGTDSTYLENIVQKAVEMANLGEVENPVSVEPVVRRHKIRRFEVESISTTRQRKARDIIIRLDGTEVFHVILQPGWEKQPDKITLVKSAKEPKNWRDEFMAMPIFPESDDGS